MTDEVKCPQCGEMVSQSVTQCDCGAYVPRTPVLHVDSYCVRRETVREWEQRLVDALNEGNRLRAENEKLRAEFSVTCRWTRLHRYSECWDTKCGNSQVIADGIPSDEEWKFCPFCGKQIEEW